MLFRSVVLVVDDEPPIRELVEDVLKGAGFRVVLAKDGDAGLALFQSERPDLVLLDTLMPGTDGWDVLSHIRQSSDCPVIIDRKSTRLNSSHKPLSYAVLCFEKKK